MLYSAGDPGREQIFSLDLDSQETTQITHLQDAIACQPSFEVAAPPNLLSARPKPAPTDVQPFERAALSAGTYLVDAFQPHVELSLDDGWFSPQNFADGFSIVRIGEGGEVDVARIQIV